MPRGVHNSPRNTTELSSAAIAARDIAFQIALTERSTGYGFYWSGEPCTVGVSTSPGTKRPVAYSVPPPLSLGGGAFDTKFVRGRPRKTSPGWVGAGDADDYETPQ
jgi:hypothetical protein